MSRGIVVYYSRPGQNYVGGSIEDLEVGNTEVVARMVAEVAGADLFAVRPARSYSVDYYACTEEAKAEQAARERPAVLEMPDVEGYDTVYLGYPNWWGTMPMFMFTVLEGLDLSGKAVMPFCTNEGSGMGSSESDIRRLCPGATVGRGLAVRGGAASRARRDVEDWVRG